MVHNFFSNTLKHLHGAFTSLRLAILFLGKVSSEMSAASLRLTVSHVWVTFLCPCRSQVAPLLTDGPVLLKVVPIAPALEVSVS